MHECQALPVLCKAKDFEYTDYCTCVFMACGLRPPWAESSYRVALKLDRIRELVEMCGRDPKSATQKDMDDCGGKVVYNEPQFGETIMSWRRAVSCFTMHWGNVSSPLTCSVPPKIKFLHATFRQD